MNARTLPYAIHQRDGAARERTRWSDPGRLIRRIPTALRLCYERHRQREILARLNDRLLEDVGLHRDDVLETTREPFWRL